MALNSGDKSSITSSVRKEIIAALSTLVMVHVTYPTSDEYSRICELLVREYPILSDCFGCGYVRIMCHVTVTTCICFLHSCAVYVSQFILHKLYRVVYDMFIPYVHAHAVYRQPGEVS